MNFRRMCGLALVTVLLCGAAPALHAQTANSKVNSDLSADDKAALDDFSKRVNDFAALRSQGPHMKQTTDIRKLHDQRNEMKKALRERRPNAKQGDIFTPQASAVFIKLLSRTFSGPNGASIRASLLHAEPVTRKETSREIRVNGGFPNQLGEPLQSSPGSLLENLPALPKDIEYRLVQRTLVLRDAESNIIIDYLPNAIPALTPQT